MSAPAKLRPVTAPLVVTANHLRSGRVVWLDAEGGWSERLGAARLFAPEATAEAAMAGQAGERALLVVGAYAVEVALKGGTPSPLKFRERLRAGGPSIAAEPRPSIAAEPRPSIAAEPRQPLPLAS
jgi:sulfite reductase (NADPH) hemoprotein beta-component